MTLEELILQLVAVEPERKIKLGFNSPHSYRGSYYDLAFELAGNVTVGSMLACAREALGSTYEGYKGGDFTMTSYTQVHLAQYGSTGDELSARLLSYMLKDISDETIPC